MTKGGAGNRELLFARHHPAKQLFFTAFSYHADLQMVAPEEGVRAAGVGAAQDRTGNNPVFIIHQLARQQLIEAGAETGFQQSRLFYLRAAKGNDAFAVQLAVEEQSADGDDLLIVEMPDLFGQADRLKEVNVRTGKPCRMRATKLVECHLPGGMAAQLAAAGLTDVDFTVRQVR